MTKKKEDEYVPLEELLKYWDVPTRIRFMVKYAHLYHKVKLKGIRLSLRSKKNAVLRKIQKRKRESKCQSS